MKPIRDIVKDPAWQKIRESLLGKWKTEPDKCCAKVRSYVTPLSSVSNDKLRIVMNYLTGTGFRTGRIKHECISKLRKDVSLEMGKRKVNGKWI